MGNNFEGPLEHSFSVIVSTIETVQIKKRVIRVFISFSTGRHSSEVLPKLPNRMSLWYLRH